ncbi:MAG: hypothetical protein ACRDKT_10945 [Actinomycetota bacterium]
MKRAFRIIAACLLAGVACGSPGATEPAGPAGRDAGRWVRIPEGPLSARRAANAFDVDGILYVLGGTEADPCPPNADCVLPKEGPQSDGAAFDPATGEWRSIAPAPVTFDYAAGTVVGDRIYLLTYGLGPRAEVSFLGYSTTEDLWAELPTPPKPEWRFLIPFEDDLIAYQGSQENGIANDYVFDVATKEWSALPVDPLAPTFDRSMVWTGDEIVLLGLPHVDNPGAEGPSLYEVATLSPGHEWRHLPASEVSFNTPSWHFAGGKVVNSSILTSDGGETNNYGRAYPTGGIFDPATEEWGELSNPPEHDYQAFEDHITGIYVGGDTWVTAGDGWAFHVPTGRWAPLTRPDGAPQYETAATWVGDRLAIWGGVSWNGSQGRLHNDGWMWEPPS